MGIWAAKTYKKCVGGIILHSQDSDVAGAGRPPSLKKIKSNKIKNMNAPGSADSNDVFVRLYGASLIPLKVIGECCSNL